MTVTRKNVSEAKYALMVWLIEHHQLTLTDLISLTTTTAKKYIADIDEENAENLKVYVNASNKAMLATTLMFPGRSNAKTTPESLRIGLTKYLKSIGRSISELDISTTISADAITATDRTSIVADFDKLF